MFSRNRDKDKDRDNGAQALAAELAQDKPPAPPQRRSASRVAAPSILCADMTVIGTLACSGDMHIDGRIEGELYSNCLTVGEKGLVNGDIQADELIVRGRVMGNIRARKVTLASTCHVEGDIIHNGLAVETGAYFQGNVRNADDQIEPALAAAEPIMEELQHRRDTDRAERARQRPALGAQPAPRAQTAPRPAPQAVEQSAPAEATAARGRSTFAQAAAQSAQAQQSRPANAAAQQYAKIESTDALTAALQKLNSKSSAPRAEEAAPPPRPRSENG